MMPQFSSDKSTGAPPTKRESYNFFAKKNIFQQIRNPDASNEEEETLDNTHRVLQK